MIETEDESRQRRPPPPTTTSKKRTMDVSESTVGTFVFWGEFERKNLLVDENRSSKHKNAADHQDKQHLEHRISIPLEVKVNQVIKQPEKTTISNRNS